MSDCPVCMGIEGYHIHMCGRGGQEAETITTDNTAVIRTLEKRVEELEKVAENAVIVCNLTEESSMIHQLLERPLRAAGYLGGGDQTSP